MASPARPVRYEFLVAGQLSESVRTAFPELRITSGPAGGTVMFGTIEDAAHLHGVLARLQDLGLVLVELRQLPD